jgi:homoserine O-acetyltransferase
VTIYDNVLLQRRLLLERFGIERLALVIGRSMGALQTFQWGCLFPDAVERILPINGTARASRHNYIFLAGLKAAMTADAAWQGGEYESPPLLGFKAFGRIYAGWMFSHAWYREELDRLECQGTLEDFLEQQWDRKFARQDANDLLSQLDTWQRADISANPVFEGDFKRALGAIKARAIVMPGATDLYFTAEDSAYEVSCMPRAELRVVPSIWGHRAGGPASPKEDVVFVETAVRELLASSAS